MFCVFIGARETSNKQFNPNVPKIVGFEGSGLFTGRISTNVSLKNKSQFHDGIVVGRIGEGSMPVIQQCYYRVLLKYARFNIATAVTLCKSMLVYKHYFTDEESQQPTTHPHRPTRSPGEQKITIGGRLCMTTSHKYLQLIFAWSYASFHSQ